MFSSFFFSGSVNLFKIYLLAITQLPSRSPHNYLFLLYRGRSTYNDGLRSLLLTQEAEAKAKLACKIG